jgi:hypothetical protein
MVGSNKKSVNRMFDRQFENQAVFLNQNYNPHINQMRPEDPRDENLREKDELKSSCQNRSSAHQGQGSPFSVQGGFPGSGPFPNQGFPGNNQGYHQNYHQMNQGQNYLQIPSQTCPNCKSMKHVPFTPDGGSVLICQDCQKTFNNIYYNVNNPLLQGQQSPWFSDKVKAATDNQMNQLSQSSQQMLQNQMGGFSNAGPPGPEVTGRFTPIKRVEQGWTPISSNQRQGPMHHQSFQGQRQMQNQTQNQMQNQMQMQGGQNQMQMQEGQQAQTLIDQQTMMQSAFRPAQSRVAVGMRGEGNYSQEAPKINPDVNNNYANYANNQLRSYRAKFDLDHNLRA